MDEIDRSLLRLLQQDATQPYAALAGAVGLSPASTHERVRKLRDSGVIRRNTIEVDSAAVGYPVLAFVLIGADAWIGSDATREVLLTLPWVQEAHIVAGSSSLLVKVRTASTPELQAVLRRLYDIEGVVSTQTTVVLETFFERPVDPSGVGADGR